MISGIFLFWRESVLFGIKNPPFKDWGKQDTKYSVCIEKKRNSMSNNFCQKLINGKLEMLGEILFLQNLRDMHRLQSMQSWFFIQVKPGGVR